MVDIASISHAIVVADLASFSRAAKALGVRQSAVSRRVRALEDDLGVSLFERDASGVRPTLAGRRFLKAARSALREIERAMKNAGAFGRGEEGLLRIGILPMILNGPAGRLLREFHEAHPGVEVDFIESSEQELVGDLFDHRLDVAFKMGPPPPGCDSEQLWISSVQVALPEGHPLAGCEGVDWDVLKEEKFVLARGASETGIYQLAVEQLKRRDGKGMIVTHDVSSDTVMQLVRLGFGLSLTVEHEVAAPNSGVVFRAVVRCENQLSCCAIWLPGNDNPALRRFLSLARGMAAKRTPAPGVELPR